MKKSQPNIIKELEQIEEREEKKLKSFIKGSKFKLIILLVVVAAIGFGVIYLVISNGKIYVEKSQISAPIIVLTSPVSGILDQVFVREGDIVSEDMIVARVGNYSIKAKTYGVVISITNTPGATVNSQTPIVKMIDPTELRVVGQVEEDKGLNQIKPGQKVMFTADAFPSKKYVGNVESISLTSHQSDIVFSISDKREIQSFDIRVKYNINDYPELKNGMSAKIWIYK